MCVVWMVWVGGVVWLVGVGAVGPYTRNHRQRRAVLIILKGLSASTQN